jgi:hypothetical protein
MSRKNPARWAVGLVVEIAAVVAAVSLLPKVDLRPRADGQRETAFVVEDTLRLTPYARQMREPPPPRLSFDTRLPPALMYVSPDRPTPVRPEPIEPPVLELQPIEPPAADPAYVEQTLDAASQQLVNGLGSYFLRTAENLLEPAAASPPASAAPHQQWRRY